MLARTFGCIRVVWNRTLAERRRLYQAEGTSLCYAASDAAVVDRWYPSSKTCSRCGYLLTGLSLGTRHWACPSCGARHDRDVNAAQNILAAGLAAGARDGADACGGTVRRAGATRTRVPVKQET